MSDNLLIIAVVVTIIHGKIMIINAQYVIVILLALIIYIIVIRMKNWQDNWLNWATEGVERYMYNRTLLCVCTVYTCTCMYVQCT